MAFFQRNSSVIIPPESQKTPQRRTGTVISPGDIFKLEMGKISPGARETSKLRKNEGNRGKPMTGGIIDSEDEVEKKCCCCCTATKRDATMVITTLIVCLSMGSFFLATSLQNVAITDSSDLGPTVGYVSGGVYYGSSAIGSLAFPLLNKCFGRISIYLFALTSYIMLYASMFVLNEYSIYVGAILAGAGGATIFILALKSIADNSTLKDLQRNMSYFWASVSIANIINNLVNFLYIQSLKTITTTIRISVYGALAGLCIVAMFLTIGLYKVQASERHDQTEIYGNKTDPEIADGDIVLDEPLKNDSTAAVCSDKILDGAETSPKNWKQKIVDGLRWLGTLAKRRSIWMIIIYQFFSGTLWGYSLKALPVTIGNVFEDRSVINLAGLVIGFSTLFGALAFKKMKEKSNNFICIFVMVVLAGSACVLSYLIFPYDANISLRPTGTTYITPHCYHVVIIATLLSLADTGFNILGFSVTVLMFDGDSSTSYTFLNTTFCIGNGVMFALAGFVNLHAYIVLLMVLTVLTGLGYSIGLRKYLIQL